jgi:hypothetical protein
MIAALLDHLWQSTLFALACAALSLAFRANRAGVRYWLWFAASLKFLLPFALLAALVLSSAAAAQSVENVTVTGTKSRQAIEAFVQSYTVPTRLTGKVARWEAGICPRVIGLPAGFGRYVTNRLKAVALAAGAPVGQTNCAPNIQIVFTGKPQALLDELRSKAPDLLGYLDNSSQRADAATFRRPIQAWYMTETVDLRGQHHVDSSLHGGGIEIRISPRLPPIFIPHAYAAAVTGTRLGDGLRSDFYHVLIVADPAMLADYEMGSLGDYIAMLALSQPAQPDACQQLDSVMTMLAAECVHRADALTNTDRAYLEGLYHMSPDRNLRTQQDEMAYRMEQQLAGK